MQIPKTRYRSGVRFGARLSVNGKQQTKSIIKWNLIKTFPRLGDNNSHRQILFPRTGISCNATPMHSHSHTGGHAYNIAKNRWLCKLCLWLDKPIHLIKSTWAKWNAQAPIRWQGFAGRAVAAWTNVYATAVKSTNEDIGLVTQLRKKWK